MAASVARAIEKAGVVGAGGGGFPTHVKASANADFMIANGAECEPLLRADGELMEAQAPTILRGLAAMSDSVSADRAILTIRRENAGARAAIEAAAAKQTRPIEVLVLENVYPAGDEFLIVYEATGRVVPEGGLPTDVGVVVNNVTTLMQVARALDGRPVTRRPVSIQGEVENPGTFDVPIGTPAGDAVALAGGVSPGVEPALIVGGPMMGRLSSDWSEPTTKTTSGLIVLPRAHSLVTARAATESHVLRTARAACCQCMACTELCPRALLGHALAPHRTVRAIQYGTEELDAEHLTSAFLCCECGMCELFACPLGIQPRRILSDLKAELSKRGVSNPHLRDGLTADDVRAYRQIPSSRLIQRLGLSGYDRPAPLCDRAVEPPRVVLLMRQHAGEAAVPVVSVGERVLEGDLVGEIPEGALGARVHASIDGTVEAVDGAAVSIVA